MSNDKRGTGYKKKTCTGCGAFLYLGQFYKLGKSKNHPDGYDCRCKDCRRREKRDEYKRNRMKPDGVYLDADGRAVEKKGNSVRLYWGEAKLKDFRRLYPVNTNEDVAIDMGCSVRTVVRRAREMGLEKSQVWLQSVWDANRKVAHAVNKVQGNKADLTNFIEGGRKHRFKQGRKDMRSAEERSECLRKAWKTRKYGRKLPYTVASENKYN